MSDKSKTDYLGIVIKKVEENNGRFRIVHPRAEASISRSMGKLGQLSPVALSRGGKDRYEMIDGFKRLRACRHLGIESIMVRVLDGPERVLKAAMVQLNRKEGVSIGVMDEALVMQPLCHCLRHAR
ncbi:MAG: ParB/RepB/Spo0J family partition protein [Syntrophobacter sp.]